MKTAARPLRLSPVCAAGARWAEFLREVPATTKFDPWELHPLTAGGPGVLPACSGPVVYAVLDVTGVCRYVGQSCDVRARFASHARNPRSARWDYVLVASLDGAAEGDLSQAERLASVAMSPTEGFRHPRRR